MGNRAQTLFIAVFLAAASCSEDSGQLHPPAENTEDPAVRTKASSFEWIRSKKNTALSALRRQWVLRGAHASEILEKDEKVHIKIDSPFIEYFPPPEAAHDRVTVISPRGIFREKDHEIVFFTAALAQVFNPENKHAHISITSSGLNYDTEKNILTGPGEFIVSAENGTVTGEGLRYILDSNLCRIQSRTRIEWRKPPPRCAPDLLPPFMEEEAHAFCATQQYRHAEKNGLNEYTVTSNASTLLNFSANTAALAGPAAFESARIFLTCDTMDLSASEPCLRPSSELALDHVRARGNIVFRERTGQKRTVTCTRLRYDLRKDIVTMTGNPVMKGKSTTITSARMKYHPSSAEFIFSKPFRIEHIQDTEQEE